MNNRYAALVALVLVQLFYVLIFTFANDVILSGHVNPFGFILLRVVCAGLLFWLFGIFTPSKKIERGDFPKLVAAGFFSKATIHHPDQWDYDYDNVVHHRYYFICNYFREPIKKIKVLGIGLGLSGALILSLYGESSANVTIILLSNFLIFINAAYYSYYLILIIKLTAKYHPYDFIK